MHSNIYLASATELIKLGGKCTLLAIKYDINELFPSFNTINIQQEMNILVQKDLLNLVEGCYYLPNKVQACTRTELAYIMRQSIGKNVFVEFTTKNRRFRQMECKIEGISPTSIALVIENENYKSFDLRKVLTFEVDNVTYIWKNYLQRLNKNS